MRGKLGSQLSTGRNTRLSYGRAKSSFYLTLNGFGEWSIKCRIAGYDYSQQTTKNKIRKIIDRSGIRTRATEVTGALNQRLRPLGHPALTCKVQ